MGQPFIGEIRIFAGNFAPNGWNFCDGTTLAISQFSTLFQLIGTTYGGNGTTTFQLPDLRGRVPVHIGSSGASNYILGQPGGAEQVVLNQQQIPSHQHVLTPSSAAATLTSPSGALLGGAQGGLTLYSAATPNHALAAAALSPAGSSQPHDNHQPYVAVSFILSLFGIFPSQ